ncbi:MAG TPA: hypothetical protein VFH68_12410 [Polyangia bacterium]|jgi:hypothetical protein|nr:hypothetical protein [Polyangia bacterium]
MIRKDTEIWPLIAEIAKVFEGETFRLIDHWDADLCAIGIAMWDADLVVKTTMYVPREDQVLVKLHHVSEP